MGSRDRKIRRKTYVGFSLLSCRLHALGVDVSLVSHLDAISQVLIMAGHLAAAEILRSIDGPVMFLSAQRTPHFSLCSFVWRCRNAMVGGVKAREFDAVGQLIGNRVRAFIVIYLRQGLHRLAIKA